LTYLVINRVKFVQIEDPIYYRVPLDQPFPENVLEAVS